MNFLLALLPADTKNLIILGKQIISALDTPAERKTAINQGIKMLKDGKVTPIEWTQWGKTLGVFKIGK
jgi:hypothetical protein